jgi:hypothetical protein
VPHMNYGMWKICDSNHLVFRNNYFSNNYKYVLSLLVLSTVVLCSLIGVNRHFRGAYCLNDRPDLA